MDCVFCKICAKKLPGKIIYQDTVLSCFLPEKMKVYGHSLIVSNKHYENIFSDKIETEKFGINISPRQNIITIKSKCIDFVYSGRKTHSYYQVCPKNQFAF